MAALLMAVLNCGLQLSSMMGRGMHPVLTRVSSGTLLVALAFTLVVASLYLARLCERIPHPKLARKIESAVRAFVYVLAITAAANTLEWFVSRSGPAGGLTSSLVIPVLATVAALLPLVSYLFAIYLMSLWLEHRKAVRQCHLQPHGLDEPEASQ